MSITDNITSKFANEYIDLDNYTTGFEDQILVGNSLEDPANILNLLDLTSNFNGNFSFCYILQNILILFISFFIFVF